jgi:class 3 adenylate cyclase/tetratricopeptide (TPR) repeat protein
VEAGPEERERKLATVLFADLVGSTAFVASHDPERARALLDRFYDAMSAEVRAAGGTVEKFAGDAVMAAFGAPAALEDHAERALHAALAMQRRLRDLFRDALALRIGVNTGEVVVGASREGSSFVTGDCVNVAARLEQAAQPGEVLVGERTFGAARGAFEFGEPGMVEAKGKPEGIRCRRLIRALSRVRPRGIGGLRRAFVGRDDELRVLERVYDEVVREGRPQLITILGDAGVGKTTLLREFSDRLREGAPETVRRTGRCLSYGQGITYWPLAEVLREHLAILASDPPEVALERLGPREILGLTLGLDVAHGLHPLAARDRFQDAWVEFLREATAVQPVVLLIEDLHWAEDQLLDLLERLVHDTVGPFLIVATARPELLEQRPRWGVHVNGHVVSLDALSAEESTQMLGQVLGGSLPQHLRDVVVQRAEGNPFFVEELLATLIDRGQLRRHNGTWRLEQLPSDFAVPDTIHAVVAARVDLLEPAEKEALQAASVIGRVFWAGPVYELVGDARPDLRVLEERDFIRRRPGSSMAGDREYAIKHAVTREVAYESVARARRARLHAAFARWLERTGKARDEYASLLGHHYAEAVRPEDVDLAWAGRGGELADLRKRAVAWLRRAGELAIGRFEIDDGIGLLHRALDLEEAAAERAALWRGIGRANVLKFDGEAFWTAMQKSLEGSDDATAARTYGELAFYTTFRGGMWRRRPDRDLVVSWISRGLELSEPNSESQTRALIARAALEAEQYPDAAIEAIDLAENAGDIELRSGAYEAAAVAAASRGDYEEAYVWTKRDVELIPELTDPDRVAWIQSSSHTFLTLAGRFEEARTLARELDEIAARLTPHHRVHAVWSFTETETLAGRWERVCEQTRRVEQAVAANIETPCTGNPISLLECALAHVYNGRDREARRLEASAGALGMEGYDYILAPRRLAIAVARGDLDDIDRKLRAWQPRGFRDLHSLVIRLNALVALKRYPEIEDEAPGLMKPRTYLEPFAQRALGFARKDRALIEQAIARFEAMGLDWHASETRKRFVA